VDYFPYMVREEQKKCIEFIRKNLRRANICIQAPTGFGKTIAILATLLTKRRPIIWAVRTGNETDRPIEELKVINKKKGTNFFGLSYRGKRDMCLLAKEMKLNSYEDVSFLCKSQKECKYDNEIDFNEILSEPLLYSEILDLCKNWGVCPYKFQRLLLPFADVVALSYNYIVNEKLGWSIRKYVPFEESYLVVDEAHNLQYACMGLNSDEISFGSVENSLKEIEKFGTDESREIENFLLNLKEKLMEERVSMEKREEEFDAVSFLKRLNRQISLIDVFSSMQRYGNIIRREQLKLGKRPRSSLYHLSSFWLNVIENIHTEGIAFIKRRSKKNFYIELFDMRASVILHDKWNMFKKCIFCSGTLAPIDAFAETIGLENYVGKTLNFSFNKNRIVALITNGISTKGEKLSKEMALKYIEGIKQFIESMNSNVAIFSASYRIQNGLLKAGLKKIIESTGRKFFIEKQGMSGEKARKILDEFKECAYCDEKGVLCATATGRFAEGADFPGKELEGIFLVGIPFDKMSIKTKLYLEYYEKLYGKKKGNYYAYIVPAMRRASQALGRALRGEGDKAVLICGDERYREKRFFNLLPYYFRNNMEVVNYHSIRAKLLLK